MLDGFVKVPILRGNSFMSIGKNSLHFSAKAAILMQRASFVNFFVNEEEKKVAIQKCNKGAGDSVSFCRSEKNFKNGVHLNNVEIPELISKIMGWDLENCGYRVDGDFLEEEQAMIFDLNVARQFHRKGRKRKDVETEKTEVNQEDQGG